MELGVVIGKEARYVTKDKRAWSMWRASCVVNDLSEREYQLERLGTWDKGKCCDTFGPFGPYLVTLDEVGDINNLGLWLEVNGTAHANRQYRHHDLRRPDPRVLRQPAFMSLQPGDVIP